jgi:hypothetical protein
MDKILQITIGAMFGVLNCISAFAANGKSTLVFTHVDGVLAGDLTNHTFVFDEKAKHTALVSTDRVLSLQLEREKSFAAILTPKETVYEGIYLLTILRTPNNKQTTYRVVLLALSDKEGDTELTAHGVGFFYAANDEKLKDPISTAKYTYRWEAG